MKTVLITLFGVLLLAGIAIAQSQPSSTNSAPSAVTGISPQSSTTSAQHDRIILFATIAQTLTMVAGFIFVTLQFRKYVSEITKTHDWNRRKASQEACYTFMQSGVHDAWAAVRSSLIGGKRFEDLPPEEQGKLHMVISYLENLGISIKNNIVDEDIIWDYFGYIWPFCYEASVAFITGERTRCHDDMICEHFEDYALRFKMENERILAEKSVAGKKPGKPRIKG